MGKVLSKMKYVYALVLCMVMVFALGACGQQDGESAGKDNKNDKEEYRYVPEFIALKEEDDQIRLSNFVLQGNSLYYCKNIYNEELKTSTGILCQYSLEDDAAKETLIKTPENGFFIDYAPDGEGNIYVVIKDYSSEVVEEESIPKIILRKYDSREEIALEKDITELIGAMGEETYLEDIIADEQENIYLCLDNAVLLFNSKGEEQGVVEVSGGQIYDIILGKNENVYIYYDNDILNVDGRRFAEIDFAGKKIGNSYKNLPGGSGEIAVGMKKDFLILDDTVVCEYNLESETYEELFDWFDYDIGGNDIRCIGLTEDEIPVAVVGEDNTDMIWLVKLQQASTIIEPSEKNELNETDELNKIDNASQTKESDNANVSNNVSEKEEIVIATLYDNQEMQDAALKFNWASDTYHITIKTYTGRNLEISQEDAITNIYKDLVSASNCPDILNLSRLDMKKLASIGAVEDLSAYLEKSTVFSKEDFLDNVLEGFTYDGVMVTIPADFKLSTVVGKTSEVGEEMGWSLQEMLEFAKEHPDSKMFARKDKSSMVWTFMEFNQDLFVDWFTGECHFDSAEFRELLECANEFPEEDELPEYVFGGDNLYIEEKQSGEVLLDEAEGMFDFYKIQLYEAMFGEEVTFIGYPTMDGSVGCIMEILDNMYGITSKSKHKDAAWAFIESYLEGSADSFGEYEFSTMKDKLQEKVDNIYKRDANGERILDESGEPIPTVSEYRASYDNWEYVYHTPTEEEVNLILEMISLAKPRSPHSDNEYAVKLIIDEEVGAYFSGQKTMNEVIEIIQNRVQNYVNENR